MKKNIISMILLPTAIVGLAAAHTTGPEALRYDFSAPAVSWADTLSEAGDTTFLDLFDAPQVMARDTIKVPDSLRLTDPFLYRYYVAVKDSLTHRMVVDSLRQAGDSLDWPRIDSLYRRDSTIAAKARFDKWFASLDKHARKRFLYEQEVKRKMHIADSVQAVKDSLRAIRDSIREATPRILETFAVPDSMQYKRIITWTHDRYNNEVNLQPLDTTLNYRFNDYPIFRDDVGAAWLGVAGSPYQTHDFFKRTTTEGVSFYEAVEHWSYSPATLPLYNTKTPYTELAYYGNLFANSEKASDNLHLMTTQNISPEFNFTLEYDRFGGEGMLDNERTANKTFTAHVNRLGRKHLLHAGYIYNKIIHEENGGLVDPFWIRDTVVDAREIGIHLDNAKSTYMKRTVFLDQSLRIPFNFIEQWRHRGDTLYHAGDTLRRDITTAFIGHSTEYSVYSKTYTDTPSSSANDGYSDFFHGNAFINATQSADSFRVAKLDNRVFIRLQPWAEDAIVSRIEGGLGDRNLTHYLFDPSHYLSGASGNVSWNSAYAYAGAEGRYRDNILWHARGIYTFAGHDANDFDINADARLQFYPFRRARTSPVSLGASFSTTLKEPGFYEQNMYTNHYRWQNSFSKISSTSVQGYLDIPYWKMRVEAGYALLKNNIWYDSLGVVRQNASPMSILKLGITKNFVLANLIHLDHRALFQISSNEDVMPFPKASLNLRYYLQFNIVSADIMKMQLGVNALYTTLWYAPSYNPVAGVFTVQKDTRYGNRPYFDVFANIQWKRACIFVKLENAGLGKPGKHADYFSAHNYIRTQRALKFGIYWPFYVQSGKSNTLSSRASSGFPGESGKSGGKGGLRSVTQ